MDEQDFEANYEKGDIDYEEDVVELNEKEDKAIKVDKFRFIIKLLMKSLMEGFRTALLIVGAKGAITIMIRLAKVFFGKRNLGDIQFISDDTKRQARVLGSFTFLYRFLNQTFQKFNLIPKEYQQAVAGGIAGTSILFETGVNRKHYTILLFLRLLSGRIDFSPQREFYGNLFYIISDFIIHFSHIFYSSYMPQDMYNLFNKFGTIPDASIKNNLKLIHGQQVNPIQVINAVGKEGFNTNNLFFNNTSLLPCIYFHPNQASCSHAIIVKLIKLLKFVVPAYTAVNLLPKLIFKWSTFMKDYKKQLYQVAKKTSQSSLFITAYIALYQILVCQVQNQVINFGSLKFNYTFIILTTLLTTLKMETLDRKMDLALYMAPKALNTILNLLNDVGLPKNQLEVPIFIACSTYLMKNLKQKQGPIKPMVSKIVNFLIDYDLYKI